MQVSRRTTITAACIAAVLSTGIAATVAALGSHDPATAETTTTTDTLSVSGSGSVQGVPDTLDVNFDISVRRGSVQSALDASNAAARRAIAVLAHDGVASKQIQSQDVFVDPDYGRHGIIGYDAGQTLAVTLHPIAHVGRILSDTTTSSGNDVRLDGLSYDITNNATLLANAQSVAFGNAKTAADKDASLAGRNLGRVISIRQTIHNTSNNGGEVLGDYAKATAGTARAAVPIEPGQQPVTVTVAVVWALQ